MRKLLSALSVGLLVATPFLAPHLASAAGAGDLVRCADSSAVYYVAEDGRRYVFPNEHVYSSWYPDFSNVALISCSDLASFQIGERVMYQAGTRLVKIPSSPTVYAIEPDGNLRPIPDEETARALYGDAWSENVDDLPETFFIDYSVDSALTEHELPEGMILTDDEGNLYRVNADGEAEDVDEALSIDQEDVFAEHAQSLEDVEDRMASLIARIEVLTSEVERLNAVIAELKLVDIDPEDAVDVEDVPEVETEDESEDATEDETENDDAQETNEDSDAEDDSEDSSDSSDDTSDDSSDDTEEHEENEGHDNGDSGDEEHEDASDES